MISKYTSKKSSFQPESKSKVIWQNVGGGRTGSWAPTPVGLRYYRTSKLKLTCFLMFGFFSITALLEM